jgi:hypothetical protein
MKAVLRSAHHYNLVSPVKQSNFHQHSQAVFRPQSNVSRVKPKPRNEQNVQHISNLSCANTGESQLVSGGTGSLKLLDRLPLVETLNATVSNPMHTSRSGAEALDWIGRLHLLVHYSTHAPRSRQSQMNETGKMIEPAYVFSVANQPAGRLIELPGVCPSHIAINLETSVAASNNTIITPERNTMPVRITSYHEGQQQSSASC